LGEGSVPRRAAHGTFAWGRRLLTDTDGRMADWPDAWPALPPPVGASDAPLPFALRYLGSANLADTARLHLQRDRTDFDARFRLPDITAWLENGAAGSPIPPLSGRLSTPALEIAGAQREGVEVEFEDEPAADATP